jgi:hypothetical protein
MAERYGGQRCTLDYGSAIAVWYTNGLPPALIRWVLVRDPSGERNAQAFPCTDLEPNAILGRFVLRRLIETTFQKICQHLGVETQRQWSDLAILRTTPALLGLYSLVTIWAHGLIGTPATVVKTDLARGTTRPSQRSATRSPPSGVCFGRQRIFPCPSMKPKVWKYPLAC